MAYRCEGLAPLLQLVWYVKKAGIVLPRTVKRRMKVSINSIGQWRL